MTEPTALITGASTGIGRACALEFARRGWRVYAGVRREADAGSLRGEHPGILPLILDVTVPEHIAAAMQVIAREAGHLNALVNNAGISVPGPLELLALDDIRLQMEVNVTAVVAVTQAALPLLRAASGQRTILMVSSGSGRVAMPSIGAYAASKFALEAISDALRVELAPWRIRVVSLQPGPVESAIWEKTVRASDERLAHMDPEGVRRYRAMIDFVKARVLSRPMMKGEHLAHIAYRLVTARRPPARLHVTTQRWLHKLQEALPVGWKNWLILKVMPKWGEED